MICLRPSAAAAAVFRWSNYARSSIRRIRQSGKLEALYCEPGSERQAPHSPAAGAYSRADIRAARAGAIEGNGAEAAIRAQFRN
jgi:hypothetical protein